MFDLEEALARARGKRALLRKMADLFLADCPGLLTQIRTALAADDHPTLERAAHRIKGSAANLSALRVVGVAGRLEEMARQGHLAAADAACAELEAEVVHLEHALEILKEEGASCEALIADDDPAALLLLESVLEDWGYEVVTARDGTEAWDVLRQR